LYDTKNEITNKAIANIGKTLKINIILSSEIAIILKRDNNTIIIVGIKAIINNNILAFSTPNLYITGSKKLINKTATVVTAPILINVSEILILLLNTSRISIYANEIIKPNIKNNIDNIYLLKTIVLREIGKDAAYLSHFEYSS